jgi:hypothetical protein
MSTVPLGERIAAALESFSLRRDQIRAFTKHYQAPALLSGTREVTSSVDLHSLGVTVAELAKFFPTGNGLFTSQHLTSMFSGVSLTADHRVLTAASQVLTVSDMTLGRALKELDPESQVVQRVIERASW